jgi:lysophospholipase L1-like esterase
VVKKIFCGVGWAFLLVVIALVAAALGNSNIADSLLWRFESFEKYPGLTQRAFEQRIHKQNLYAEQHLKSGTPLFFGDSHLQLIPPEATLWAANFAIGGQTIKRVIESVPKFKSVATASVIFINGGENDLLTGDSVENIGEYWQALLSLLPKEKRLVCVGLPEAELNRVNAYQVKLLNTRISEVCGKNGAQFLAIQIGLGEFKAEQMASDNLHLSRSASMKLARLMEEIAKQPESR